MLRDEEVGAGIGLGFLGLWRLLRAFGASICIHMKGSSEM